MAERSALLQQAFQPSKSHVTLYFEKGPVEINSVSVHGILFYKH